MCSPADDVSDRRLRYAVFFRQNFEGVSVFPFPSYLFRIRVGYLVRRVFLFGYEPQIFEAVVFPVMVDVVNLCIQGERDSPAEYPHGAVYGDTSADFPVAEGEPDTKRWVAG